MLADRFGGRVVFTVLMFFVAVPVALVPASTTYKDLLVVAFLLGMAGSSFAVGVAYVSRWFSMESQGSALGVYGLGNIGQSAAVFLGPVVAAAYGYRAVYWGMSIILLVWAVLFVIFARNAPHAARPKGLSEMLGVLAREPLAWALAAFYFLTFGGFVAFSIYLPTLLRDQFGLRPTITKKISWHTFRHTFSSILKQSGQDIKVVQELMRHASSTMTLDTYTQALGADKRAAQSQVVGMIRPQPGCTVVVPRVSDEICVTA